MKKMLRKFFVVITAVTIITCSLTIAASAASMDDIAKEISIGTEVECQFLGISSSANYFKINCGKGDLTINYTADQRLTAVSLYDSNGKEIAYTKAEATTGKVRNLAFEAVTLTKKTYVYWASKLKKAEGKIRYKVEKEGTYYIQVGGLGRPFLRCGEGQGRIDRSLAGSISGSDTFSFSIEQFELGGSALALELDTDGQGAVLIGSIQVRRDADVLDPLLGTGVEVAVPSNTAVAEEVLVLQIGSVAPAENLERDEVLLAGDQVLRHVELGFQLAVLAVADKLAVYPKVDVGGHGTEVEEDVLAGPGGGNFEFTAVGAYVVVLDRDLGRVALELVAPGISGVHVDGIAESVEFPHAGDGNRIPALVIETGRPETRGTLVGVAYPVEFPGPVDGQVVGGGFGASGEGQAVILIREIMGMHRGAVHGVHGRILPLFEGLRRGREAQGEDTQKGSEDLFHLQMYEIKWIHGVS